MGMKVKSCRELKKRRVIVFFGRSWVVGDFVSYFSGVVKRIMDRKMDFWF